MEEIKWQFTKTNAPGNNFIDGSTEVFKSGKWGYLTREVIQNSLDALKDEDGILKLDMEFIEDFPTKYIPDKESIVKHIKGTLSFEDLPDRCKKFSNAALNILMAKR